MRHPTWNDIRRFCEVEGWAKKRTPGRSTRRDHDRYVLALSGGRVLRTKASHGRDEIGDESLVRHILRDQLEVTEDEFWAAVDDGTPPDRGGAHPPIGERDEPAHSLPDWLAVNLAVLVGLSDEEIAQLSEDQALARWNEWCSQPRD